ncbi:MAG: ribosomal protein S18-alanine N-acetyltransferase [Clostridia bacterium]|nr:ribosomal protein S18-alanine N-acetyltransferase [Clostridia bacterium]
MKFEIVYNARDFVGDIAETEKLCFSEPWSEDAVSDFLGYEYNGAIICLADGAFAGYVTYTSICGEIQIANVASKPDFRRMGVGSLLMDALGNLGKETGAEVITLEVRSKNTPAIGLYEKYGFVTVGVRKNFYKKPDDDAVLMNLDLQN